jgi:hypothetical protein
MGVEQAFDARVTGMIIEIAHIVMLSLNYFDGKMM